MLRRLPMAESPATKRLKLAPSGYKLLPSEQTSFMMNNIFHEGLIKTINMLDFPSFLRLSRTCQQMNDFCLNTKGISVFSDQRNVTEREKRMGFSYFEYKLSVNGNECHAWKWDSRSNVRWLSTKELEKLSHLPVGLKVACNISGEERFEDDINDEILTAMETFLNRFRMIHVSVIEIDGPVTAWSKLEEMIQDVSFRSHYNDFPFSLLTKVRSIYCYCLDVPDDDLLDATAEHIQLPRTLIAVSTFSRIVEKFFDGSIVYWELGIAEYYKDYREEIVKKFSTVRRSKKMADILSGNMEPRVWYRHTARPNSLFCLLNDGTPGQISFPRYADEKCIVEKLN